MKGRYAESPVVGIDLHRQRSVVVTLGQDGSCSPPLTVLNSDPGALVAAVDAAGPAAPVAVEACYGWYWVVDVLRAGGHPVTLVHPSGLGSTWENRRVKNDGRDAAELARRLARGDLPTSWISTPNWRQARELVRFRHKLVQHRSSYKTQVHAVLAKEGVFIAVSDLFGVAGRAQLAQLRLGPGFAERVQTLLELIDHLDTTLARVDAMIRDAFGADPQLAQALQRVQIVPGIGPVLGAVLVAEIGDIARFSSAPQLCCWAGMTPRHRESDRKVHRGPITKQGNRLVRWAAVEAVQKHRAPDTPMETVRRRILSRRRDATNIAKVAAGRELLECVYYALRDGYVQRLTDVRTGQVAESRSC